MTAKPDSKSDFTMGRRPFLYGIGAALFPFSADSGTFGDPSAYALLAAANLGTGVSLTHGAAVGDVRATTAVIWARRASAGTVRVEWSTSSTFSASSQRSFTVSSTTDYAGKVKLTGLAPGSQYFYRVWGTSATTAPSGAVRGKFRTAPASTTAAPVTFAFGSCNYGFGRTPQQPPFRVFDRIVALNPDFFLHLGDTIYADAATPAGRITTATNPANSLSLYRAKYREMRETNFQNLLPVTSVYPIWDDHEVINNFESSNPLMPYGRQAFLEYWPFDRDTAGTQPTRLYNSFRWGKHMELFILDTRQYRSLNYLDSDTKTLLGATQLAWLKTALAASTATFKFVTSGGPVGRPSNTWVSVRPAWGYEDELREIFTHIETNRIDNVVFLTGDVHHPFVGAYDPDGDGLYEIHEVCSSPMGVHVSGKADLYGPLHPRTFYNAHGYFNFGVVRVDAAGTAANVEIRDELGTLRFAKVIPAQSTTGNTQPTRIESSFDHGTNGWRVYQNGTSLFPDYFPTGGRTGGCIGDSDAAGGTWYYQAPFKYRGDRRTFYGGTLSFDLQQQAADSQFETTYRFKDVALRSATTVLAYDFGPLSENPPVTWKRYTIPLRPSSGWRNARTGALAIEAEFRAVLGDLDGLYIRGEYRKGADASRLDNVVLAAPT